MRRFEREHKDKTTRDMHAWSNYACYSCECVFLNVHGTCGAWLPLYTSRLERWRSAWTFSSGLASCNSSHSSLTALQCSPLSEQKTSNCYPAPCTAHISTHSHKNTQYYAGVWCWCARLCQIPVTSSPWLLWSFNKYGNAMILWLKSKRLQNGVIDPAHLKKGVVVLPTYGDAGRINLCAFTH